MNFDTLLRLVGYFCMSNISFLNTGFETPTAVLAFSDNGTSEYFFFLGFYVL